MRPASYIGGMYPLMGEPLYPSLWRGCVGAWAPCLGPTGLTLRDWSGCQNHGTLTNMDTGTDWLQSQGKYALDFDGSNDRVDASRDTTIKTSMTAAAWVMTLSTSGEKQIIHCGGTTVYDYLFLINRVAGKVTCGWGNVDILTSASAITAASWNHVAFTRVGSGSSWTTKIFINGREDASGTTAGTPNASAGTVAIIGALTSGLFHWYGQLDDIRLYGRALSQNEIRLLASRRGVSYELAPRRMARLAGFKSYWAARKAQIIGGGV